MGYRMRQMDADFRIKKENIDKALKAILSEEKDLHAESLQEAMWGWGWTCYEDESGIISIIFEGEKFIGDDRLMEMIAPWVEDGSYIQMIGEDDYIWRWVFQDGKCYDITGRIEFDEPTEQDTIRPE